jgi:hypothetical protein
VPGSAVSKSRSFWFLILLAIIAVGIGSRLIHTGFPIFDKHLGDALYAAMVYAILRLRWQGAGVTIGAVVIMLAIELFQLTGIPARLVGNEHLLVRLCGRLLGTEFSLVDLFAYCIGIACIRYVDVSRLKR